MVIGIAGGVGSGKSTVLNILKRQYGAYICMADELGHRAMNKGTKAYEKIQEVFGESILCEGGEIDREALAQIVYRNAEKLEALSSIIHPFVKEEIRKEIRKYGDEGIFVLETAILFETGCSELCDEVWGVITEDEIRICRLMESRGYTREKAESIMEKQMDNKRLTELCDHIIVNDGNMEELSCQIRELCAKKRNLLNESLAK